MLPEFSFPTVTYGIAFLLFFCDGSVAMDKLVIGRVLTPIDYLSIQFSIRLAVATVIALLAKFRCSHAAKGVPSTSMRAPH